MLWPDAGTVDPVDLYASARRPAVGDRPWLMLNMIASLDGATADPDGRSGGLGGPPDRAVFTALRARADVIVAGAGTVRTERYGQARVAPDLQAARAARGQAPRPRIAVVSGSLHLDPTMRLFTDAGPRPLVVTTAAAPASARRRLAGVADLVDAGDSRLDWHRALVELRRTTGADILLAEGGPTVNGQLIAADLVDELCLTLAPQLAGGPAARLAHAPAPAPLRHARLAHALEADGFLLLRYVTDRDRTI